MRNNRIINNILLFNVINFIFILPSFAAPSEVTKDITWSYVIKLDDQPYAYSKVTIIEQKKLQNQSVWTIKDESVYKWRLENGDLDEYRSQTIFKLREDFTLISMKMTKKKNGDDFRFLSINKKEFGYVYLENSKGKIEERCINTEKPLYFYNSSYPWIIEILIKNNVLAPQKPCPAIFLPDKIILLEYSKNSSLADDKNEYFCYQAGSDKIYLNINQEVVKIDSMNDGIIKVMPGEGFSEAELIGYDTKKIAYLISNVPLIKRDHIKNMTVYVNIEQGMKNVDYLLTSSLRQNFSGTVTDDRIEGEITIIKETTIPKNPFSFPVKIEWEPKFDEYLESQPLIEADAPEIIAKAKEITKEANNTWEAALAIAQWVRQNIKYGKVGELSALNALKTGKGECAEISFLTTAMCRAVKMPARVIFGYAYVNDLNAFGLHNWVEVYTDEIGWRSMDPTWKQFEFLDSTHIGLSDASYSITFSSIKPGIIKVLEYAPKEAGPMTPSTINISKLKLNGNEWCYEIFDKSNKIGDYTATLTVMSKENYCLLESLNVPFYDIFLKSKLIMDRKGYVLNYSSDGLLEGLKIERELNYDNNLKYRGILGENRVEREVPRIFQNEVQTDLLRFVQWGLVAARLVKGVKAENSKTVTVFSANFFQNSNLDVLIKPCKIDFKGKKVKGWFCEITGGQYKTNLHITKDLVITKVELPEIEITAILID